ncbi:MAG: hypothetical protein IT200_15570 [Thermoleophilia bacterium]|nr:hypothetical protein [Thermoleophilia bacterium]
MRTASALLVSAAFLAGPVAAATAETVTADDGRGNTMRFSLEAPGASAAEPARILRDSVHGAEVATVLVHLVPAAQVGVLCGSATARACYRGRYDGTGEITVPAVAAPELDRVLLHEYGHHVDNNARNTGTEPDGTPGWWRERGVATLLADGRVARDYALGWDRSVGELFAEDYVQLNVRAAFAFDWIAPPSQAVLDAMRQDITGSAQGPAPRQVGGAGPDTPPATAGTASRVRVGRTGVLRPRGAAALRFRLLGPGRRVAVSAVVGGRGRGLRVALSCAGHAVASARTRTGRARLVRTGLGPAACTARVRNTGRAAVTYRMRVELTTPGAG